MKRLSKHFPSNQAWLLMAAMALGLTLRLANLGTEPLWGDEILSWDIVRHFWGATGTMLEYLKQVEVHPPGYYLFLRGWLAVAGQTELAVRLPSVIFSVGTIAVVWGFARSLYADRRTSVVAAFLIALLPMQIEFGQEGRPYAMACFFSLAAAWALWVHVRDRRAWTAMAYALCQAAAIMLHYSAILPLVAMAAWWFFRAFRAERPEERAYLLRSWLAAHAAVFLAFWWWLDAFFFKWFYASMPIEGLPPRARTGGLPADFFEKVMDQLIWTAKEKALPKIELFASGLFKLLAAWFGIALAAKGARPLKPATAYLLWLAVGTLVLYMCSPQSVEYNPLSDRHVLFVSLALGLLIARLIAVLPPRRAAVLGAILLCSLVPRIAFVADDDGKTDPYFQVRAAAQAVDAGYRPGDAVFVWQAMIRTDFNHYLRPDIEALPILPVAYKPSDDAWNSRETLGFIENESQLRLETPAIDDVTRKLDVMLARSAARRVWVYGGSPDFDIGGSYFSAKGWRTAIRAIQPIFPLTLYVKD